MPFEVAELLRSLVAFDTTSGKSTRAVVDFIRDRFDRPGVRIQEDPSEDGERHNLVVWLGPETGEDHRSGLILSGHLDTVPAGEDGWRSDPWQLTDGGDRWLGRGTCDMKGFLALSMALACELEPARLRAPLVLLLTHDEELGSLGAQRFASGSGGRQPLPRRTVIGEPTSLEVVRMHKGHLRLRLVVRGRSAHSGFPDRGRNAIEAAAGAIDALVRLKDELATERPANHEMFPSTPFVALNVGLVRGGSAVNVIPDRCQVDLGLRPLPGTSSEELKSRVSSAVGSALPDDPWTLEVDNDSPAMLLPEEAPIHRELGAILGQSDSRGVSFSSDAGVLQGLDLDCVLYGPGSIEVAHRPNEFIPKSELTTAEEHLRRLIHDQCLSPVA